MGSLTALVLATPVFGFALTPPPGAPAVADPAPAFGLASQPSLAVDTELRVGPSRLAAPQDAADDEDFDEGDLPAEEEDYGDEEIEEIEVDLGGGDEEASEEMAEFARAMQQRADMTRIHRPLGIAAWAAMGVTVLLGGIQFHNLYGTWSSLEDTPCVQGDAIFGQDQCSGTPYAHLITASVTAALYSATFLVSLLMPDPDNLDEGDSEYAQNLRMHKILRWIHFGGMLAQFALGIVIANAESFGLDRANDYGTLQALSTVHLGLGLVTFGAMTWAGALFTL
ncbi:MAG: hypothetical protein AAGF12_42715 [Myxococcota bacterium]